MPDTNEQSLLRRFRGGDADAFEHLFDACAPDLQRRLDRRVSDRLRRKMSVADLLQEVRLSAWQHREQFEDRGPGAFRNWLLGIADHGLGHARERFRAEKRDLGREITQALRADTGELHGANPSPSQVAIGAELQARLRAAIDALPELQREVVRLAYRDHLGLTAIAERLGKSYEATKKIRARALLQIAAVLRPVDGE